MKIGSRIIHHLGAPPPRRSDTRIIAYTERQRRADAALGLKLSRRGPLLHAMSTEDVTESLFEELASLDAESALSVVSRWLASNRLERTNDALMNDVMNDPNKWGENPGGGAAAGEKQQGGSSKPAAAAASATPTAPPVGEALPVPGTSTRPGRLFDAEPIDPSSVSELLLTKPDPVFFGERDDKRREQAATEEFPLTVRRRSPSSLPIRRARIAFSQRFPDADENVIISGPSSRDAPAARTAAPRRACVPPPRSPAPRAPPCSPHHARPPPRAAPPHRAGPLRRADLGP